MSLNDVEEVIDSGHELSHVGGLVVSLVVPYQGPSRAFFEMHMFDVPPLADVRSHLEFRKKKKTWFRTSSLARMAKENRGFVFFCLVTG